MSLYNQIHGVNQAAFWFLPMLGKHPDEYPRFRDCFTSDEAHPEYNDHIHVFTRTGGGNRDHYDEGNQMMKSMDGFVTDFDDSFDKTFASWVFKISAKWKKDYDAICRQDLQGVSEEYREQIKKVYPKLAEKVDSIFGV